MAEVTLCGFGGQVTKRPPQSQALFFADPWSWKLATYVGSPVGCGEALGGKKQVPG